MSLFSEPFLSDSHREEWEEWLRDGQKRQSEQPPMSPAEFIAQVERLRNQNEEVPSKSESQAKPPHSGIGPKPTA